jgi:hypothetical protein
MLHSYVILLSAGADWLGIFEVVHQVEMRFSLGEFLEPWYTGTRGVKHTLIHDKEHVNRIDLLIEVVVCVELMLMTCLTKFNKLNLWHVPVRLHRFHCNFNLVIWAIPNTTCTHLDSVATGFDLLPIFEL